MKKILFLLLLTISMYGQEQEFDYGIKIPNNTKDTVASKVNVQNNDGVINYILKSDLVDVVEVTSALTLPVTGVGGKIYITKDNNKIYRWKDTFYQELAVTDISNKVDKVAGKGLSTEDYTTAEKTKLAGIQAGATANATDAQLRDRTTHTGTQAINTVIGLQAAIDAKINISLIGANNGITPLDAGGKVSFAYLPASLMIYKGMWNPATNTPTLADGTGVAGWVYKANANGTIDLGSGNIVVVANDFIIHNGTKWEWSSGTDAVVSVNGQQGVVALNTSHIPDTTNKRYQTDAQQANNNATSPIQQQIDGKQPLENQRLGTNSIVNFRRLELNGPVNEPKEIYFKTNGIIRWDFGTTTEVESGGNTGSNLNLYRYADNGDYLGTVFSANRKTGVFNFETTPTIFGNQIVSNNGGTYNIGINGNATSFGGEIASFATPQFGSLSNLIGIGTGGGVWRFTPSAVNTWLGLNNGSTLNNNISGTASSAERTVTIYYNNIDVNTLPGLIGDNTTSYSYSVLNTNGPISNRCFIITNRISSSLWTQTFMGTEAGVSDNQQWVRTNHFGTVGAWRKVWSDVNFNPANYLPLSGGTLSGLTTWNNAAIKFQTASTDISLFATTYQIAGSGSTTDFNAYVYGNNSYGIWTNGTKRVTVGGDGNTAFQGSITASGFFQQSSDRRLKYVHKRDGEVAYFTWKDGRDDKMHIGWIAQEVRKQFPDQVQKNDDGYLSVSYIEILVAKNRDLEKKLEALEDRINQLEKSK